MLFIYLFIFFCGARHSFTSRLERLQNKLGFVQTIRQMLCLLLSTLPFIRIYMLLASYFLHTFVMIGFSWHNWKRKMKIASVIDVHFSSINWKGSRKKKKVFWIVLKWNKSHYFRRNFVIICNIWHSLKCIKQFENTFLHHRAKLTESFEFDVFDTNYTLVYYTKNMKKIRFSGSTIDGVWIMRFLCVYTLLDSTIYRTLLQHFIRKTSINYNKLFEILRCNKRLTALDEFYFEMMCVRFISWN